MIVCKFENGNEASLRHVVIHCLVIKDNKILLVKRAGGILESGKWGFPGGFLDQGETIMECAVRELKEETGYDGVAKKVFRINSIAVRKNDQGRNNVAAEVLIDIGEKTGQPDWEQSEVKWFDIEKVDGESLAFDHGRTIELLKDYFKNKTNLPIIE